MIGIRRRRLLCKVHHARQVLITHRGWKCGGGRKSKVDETKQSTASSIRERAQPHSTLSPAMLFQRIRALPTGSSPSITTIETALSALRLSSPAVTNTSIAVRYASHKAQGAANSAKDGAGKRLGAKKSGGTDMHDFFLSRIIHLPRQIQETALDTDTLAQSAQQNSTRD